MKPGTKQVVVELYGSAREIAGVREVELDLEPEATVGDVVRLLAGSCPRLLGTIIDPASWTVREHFLLNLDGRETVQRYELQLLSGARLLLISALAGGR